MELNIGLKTHEVSNIFLRALWEEIARIFGKCAWQFSPYKLGEMRRVFIGYMSIGDKSKETIQVSVSYKRKGVIDTIAFNRFGEKIEQQSELGILLNEAVINALKRMDKPDIFCFETIIYSLHFPISRYEGKIFEIQKSTDNRCKIIVPVKAFGEKDARNEFNKTIQPIMDFLSVETNIPFWEYLHGTETTFFDSEFNLKFWEDNDWIDGFPIENGEILISKTGADFIDLIAKGNFTVDLELFLRACRHFHTARKFDAQIYDRTIMCATSPTTDNKGEYRLELFERDKRLSNAFEMGSEHEEVATVLYLSALEVASLIGGTNPKKCDTCGQLMYSISSRVRDLVGNNINEHVAQRIIKDYGFRSKYLHEGMLLNNNFLNGISVPQLDLNHPSGCKAVKSVSLINLREYTSYILRKVSLSFLNDDFCDA